MFPIRLFGYDRADVEQVLHDLHAKIEELSAAYEASQHEMNQLRAQIEDYSIRLAAARRDRIQAFSQTGSNTPNAMIVIGPVSTFATLARIADELERLPELSIHFRIFRDGVYRLDVWSEDLSALSTWFRQQLSVREVHEDQNTIHVIVKEEVEP